MADEHNSVRNEIAFHPHLTLIFDTILSTMASALAVTLMRVIAGTFVYFQIHGVMWIGAAFVSFLFASSVTGCNKIVTRYMTLSTLRVYFFAVFIKEVLLCLLLIFGLINFGTGRQALGLLICDFSTTIFFIVFARVMAVVMSENSIDRIGTEASRMPVMVCDRVANSIPVLTHLTSNKDYQIKGILTTNPDADGHILGGVRIYTIKGVNDLNNLQQTIGFDGVVVSSSNKEDPCKSNLVDMAMQLSLNVLMAPTADTLSFGGGYNRNTARQMTRNDTFIPDGMSGLARNTKRIIDCSVAALLLIIFSPLFLICWIAVKCDDNGPAFYGQERIGRFGRPFTIHKFRSMRMDAESMGPALFSGEEDPRLTRVGKFMRLHHLDELPQLWNVFVGDMAFVGYRPERQFFIEQIIEADPRYVYLYQIRPGVTSYATLKNGYTDTLEKMLRRLELDLYYLRNRSLWFDISILFQTFTNIVFGKKF